MHDQNKILVKNRLYIFIAPDRLQDPHNLLFYVHHEPSSSEVQLATRLLLFPRVKWVAPYLHLTCTQQIAFPPFVKWEPEQSSPVFLNGRSAAPYRTLASIIPYRGLTKVEKHWSSRCNDLLWAGWFGIRTSVGARECLLSTPVKYDTGVQTAPSAIGTGFLSWLKSGRGVSLTTHCQLTPRLIMWVAIPLLPLCACILCCYGETFPLP